MFRVEGLETGEGQQCYSKHTFLTLRKVRVFSGKDERTTHTCNVTGNFNISYFTYL